ncbi:MAG: hypothetical protein V3W34_15745 [Phycisphaerae bacterium]
MLRMSSFFVAVSMVVHLVTVPATADELEAPVSNQGDSIIMTGTPMPATGFAGGLASCPFCPKMYENTTICTVNVQAITLGGRTPNGMSPRDWFVTGGGEVSGFDVFVMNGSEAPFPANPQNLSVAFLEGANSQFQGAVIQEAQFGTQRRLPLGISQLTKIPAWDDPNTGKPGLMRVTVNYDAGTYNLVGLHEDPNNPGTLLEEQLSPVDEPLGGGQGRVPFTLPAGPLGVDVRLTGEFSICNTLPADRPKAGPVLAGGGAGAEDGLHINALYGDGDSDCSPAEYPLFCDNSGWGPTGTVLCEEDSDCIAVFGEGTICEGSSCRGEPGGDVLEASVPCVGGDVCNLDRPFFGIALIIYIGPSEQEGGDNTIDTADAIPAPPAGSGEIVTARGFLGDNGLRCNCASPGCVCTEFPLYDHDEPDARDGDVDLIDWGDFQRCFGRFEEPGCGVHDQNGDGAIDLVDYGGENAADPRGFDDCFTRDTTDPGFTPNDPANCTGSVPPAPEQLADVDIHEISGLSAGAVVSILVEGSKSPTAGPLWDPFLRVFDGNGRQIPFENAEGGESDDFDRVSLDAYTSVVVPPGSTRLYAGVSTSGQITKLEPPVCDGAGDCVAILGEGATCGNQRDGFCDLPCAEDADCQDPNVPGFPAGATCGRMTPGFCDLRVWYDPADPDSIKPIGGEEPTGSYTLSIAVTDPESVSGPAGGAFQCIETQHEPDDDMDAADDRATPPSEGGNGNPTGPIIYGAIGDGAFAPLGQDIDIYRLEFSGLPGRFPANTRSITAEVMPTAALGFWPTFDLAMALYDSDGELIAVSDQAPRGNEIDSTRPSVGVNLCGTSAVSCQNESPQDGIYYMAVFGTDRVSYDEDGDPIQFPDPPTRLNFPHGTRVAATSCSDLRPTIGSRVSVPGPPLEGRDAPVPQGPNSPTLACYRINISTFASDLDGGGVFCEEGPNGNDSIPDASTSVSSADRLAAMFGVLQVCTLGDGPYGLLQGDVDFYLVAGAVPGKIVSVSTCDNQQPPTSNSIVRNYVALYDQEGFVFADQDYSLERYDGEIFILDHKSDEMAATVASLVPSETGKGNPLTAVYAMVGLDNGKLLQHENTPFDANFPGTTLSRRFFPDNPPRRYRIGIAVMDPLPGDTPISDRVFAVARRGIDGRHTEPFTTSPEDSTKASFPSILELNPKTGEVVALLDATVPAVVFNTFREPDGCTENCPDEISANPVIAYDGETLFVSVEKCGDENCNSAALEHRFFEINPDLVPGDGGFVVTRGKIRLEEPLGAVLTGMAEMDGFLYALNSTSDRMRYWPKELLPGDLDNGGTIPPTAADPKDQQRLTDLACPTDGAPIELDDVNGDIGTDGEFLYISCFSDTGLRLGICKFSVDLKTEAMACVGILADPISVDNPNLRFGLVPGPRLGGLDILADNTLMTTDRNGPIVEYGGADAGVNDVKVVQLPREFLVERITARPPIAARPAD